jgi:hypothetical protein
MSLTWHAWTHLRDGDHKEAETNCFRHDQRDGRQGEIITDGETEPRTEKLEMAELSFGLACLGLSSEFETSTGARGDDHHEQPTPKLDGVASSC